MCESHFDLSQSRIQRERLLAGAFRLGCEGSVACAFVTDGVALAQARVGRGEARIDGERVVEHLFGRVECLWSRGLAQLRDAGEVLIGSRALRGGRLSNPLRQVAG